MLKQSLLAITLAASSLSANAALFDRGNGMIYDDVLDITWLQDANYAATQYAATGGLEGDADGRMTWADANAWADNLSYGGNDDWRLASAGNAPTSGPKVTTGELGQMYFNNLGNQSSNETGGTCFTAPEYCLKNTSFTDGDSGGSVSFLNVKSNAYWYGEESAPNSVTAWIFATQMGSQSTYNKGSSLYGWAVRDGDVSAVPVPGAVWLFGSALLGLAGLKQRK